MPNQYGNPVTDEERQRVRELHAQGLGRNAIAKEMGRAQRTISLIAAELGLTFDTSMTEDATRARVAQLAALRADTALDLHMDALRLTQRMWEPTEVFAFGGKDNRFASRQVAEPPAADKKALMTAAVAALGESRRLVPPADDSGAEEGRSMLGQLMRGLKAAYDEAGEEGSADKEAEGESP